MFSLASIWKRGFGRHLAVAALTLLFSLIPTLAIASNENYAWGNDNHSAISATGGSYSGTVTFNKSGSTYVATTPTYTCDDGSTGTATGKAVLSGTGTSLKLNNNSVTLPPGCTIDPLDTSITVANANTATTTSDDDNSCDQGSFSWFACPLMANLASTITTWVKDGLQELLMVNPLQTGNSPLYQTWSNIRNFADVLFIVIFLAIIFSTSIQNGFDQYTIKKMLPRLVFAVVLVQISYFLVGGIIDIGNVLGRGVDDLLVSVVHPHSQSSSTADLFTNIGSISTGLALASGAYVAFSHGFWVAALPILLGILISIAVVFITLGMRYIVLAALIILSPLAFVAWVLPNTEKHFHKWMSALLRLVMMYPIIMAILSIASHLNDLLPFGADTIATGPATVVIAILKPLIIIAALALIPLTFRWAGAAIGNSHRFIQGLAGRANGSLKGSAIAAAGRAQRDMNRNEHLLRKQNRAMMLRDPNKAQEVMSGAKGLRKVSDKVATSEAFGGAGKKITQRTHGTRMWARGMALGTTASTGMTLQRSYNTQFKNQVKGLGDLEDSEATFPNLQTAIKGMYGASETEKSENMRKLRTDAPSLVNYTRTVQGRAALIRKLSDMKGIDDDLTRRMMEDKRGLFEYNQFIGGKAAKPDPKEKPTITFSRAYDGSQPQNTKFLPMAAGQIQGLSVSGFNSDFHVANWTAATGRVTGKDDKGFPLYTRDELSKTIAKTILDNASFSAVNATFDPTNRNFSDQGKRAAIVRMLHDNADMTTEGNGKLIRDGIFRELVAQEQRDPATGAILRAGNTDIYDSLIEQAVRSDGFRGAYTGQDADTVVGIAKGWGNDEHGLEQKRNFIKTWLGI